MLIHKYIFLIINMYVNLGDMVDVVAGNLVRRNATYENVVTDTLKLTF
jgi:hypothetical protein